MTRAAVKSVKPRARINVLTFAIVLEELQAGHCSVSDLMEKTGYSRHCMLSFVRAMHERETIHIVGYECDSLRRERSPIYALGRGVDKPRRTPETPSVSCKRYQERLRLRLVERVGA